MAIIKAENSHNLCCLEYDDCQSGDAEMGFSYELPAFRLMGNWVFV